jgi:D-alanyl-lipoteichoic acid acyltransferase DltB (MBOAT superfamily)
MLFNTLDFWAFFAVVYCVYRILGMRTQNIWLLGASYVFYAFWDYRFVLLLAGSTAADWGLARRISREASREGARKWVAASVGINLLFLGVFKYFNFFVGSFAALIEGLGFKAHVPVLEIVLPVGISFYTFQSMSYIVDVYRGDIEPTPSLVEFALFVAFFPHMVAGPIMKAKALLPQMGRPRVIGAHDISAGFHLAMVGLFKKVVIADNLAPIADVVFSRELGFVPGVLHVGALAFAFQIYADFSGYSDIARGIARMMGFTLMENFDLPYFATSITDFWRRWHISLSTWLREYLYIPLGGNRGGSLATLRNLMITMTLGGLWHGAAATYVVWGVYQGALLAVERAVRALPGQSWMGRLGRRPLTSLRILVTFHFVCLGWIYFRATPDAPLWLMTRRFINPAGWLLMPADLLWPALLAILPLLALDVARRWSGQDLALLALPWPARGLLYSALAYVFILTGRFDSHAFIYFQF